MLHRRGQHSQHTVNTLSTHPQHAVNNTVNTRSTHRQRTVSTLGASELHRRLRRQILAAAGVGLRVAEVERHGSEVGRLFLTPSIKNHGPARVGRGAGAGLAPGALLQRRLPARLACGDVAAWLA